MERVMERLMVQLKIWKDREVMALAQEAGWRRGMNMCMIGRLMVGATCMLTVLLLAGFVTLAAVGS